MKGIGEELLRKERSSRLWRIEGLDAVLVLDDWMMFKTLAMQCVCELRDAKAHCREDEQQWRELLNREMDMKSVAEHVFDSIQWRNLLHHHGNLCYKTSLDETRLSIIFVKPLMAMVVSQLWGFIASVDGSTESPRVFHLFVSRQPNPSTYDTC